jgi:hypothetical protein
MLIDGAVVRRQNGTAESIIQTLLDFCFKNFHSNWVQPIKQLFMKDVQRCLATTRQTSSVSHVSKNQWRILLRTITLYSVKNYNFIFFLKPF